jgi:hypothetical protein
MLPSNKQSAYVHKVHAHRQKPVQACSDIANMSKANHRKDQPFCNDITTLLNSHTKSME